MDELKSYFAEMLEDNAYKFTISKPGSRLEEYKKITVEKKKDFYQVAKYTEKQVFHENVKMEQLTDRLAELVCGHYLRVNAWSEVYEYAILISKKGSPAFRKTAIRKGGTVAPATATHNRKKNYILEEGTMIPPLVDMGVFTAEGKIVSSMYDKFKQINRFLEIIDDSVKNLKTKKLNVIDFGCGKSYLTFVVYYYLTEIKGFDARILGLDLKADVIKKCNEAAVRYGYTGLSFELGDINGYKADFDVDMVITLHACDTATDYALFNAVLWKAKMIFSVPCCQHELNSQIKPQNLNILSDYGIIKERFSALATDAIRGKLLEYCGYKINLLEFVDFEHTPKNILIRGVWRPMVPAAVKTKALEEVDMLCKEFGFEPTLYRLLKKEFDI
ncbi:MAG: class I SAM-dependent methyltransferase [Lachnospiraceae bacterium]